MTVIKTDAKCQYCGKRGLEWRRVRKKTMFVLMLMDGEWEHKCNRGVIEDKDYRDEELDEGK